MEKITQLCESNDQTKENKLTVAIQKFDKIQMNPRETLRKFDERSSIIIIELSYHGNKYTKCDIALKVIRALFRE